jgi:arabinose-5-phosphate isomerase
MEATQTKNRTERPLPSPGWDGPAALARGRAVLQAEASAIEAALAKLDDCFVAAVTTILDCKGRVCVTGMGKAGLIGAKIQATLASTGTLAYALHPVDALHGDLGMIHPDDVVLALSKSGSSELVQLLPRLARLGCRIILMTARPDSAAAKHADVILDIGQTAEACPLGLAPSSSTTTMLALGDALALTVMELKAVRHEEYASYHPGGALGRFLMKAAELMRTGADCPSVRETATLGECYEAILAAPRRAGAAAIVNGSGMLVGIITHGDFFRLFKSPGCPADRPVSQVMTRAPKRVRQEARVNDALQIMRQFAIDELPVVDQDDRLVGMIDIQDLLARGFSVFESS